VGLAGRVGSVVPEVSVGPEEAAWPCLPRPLELGTRRYCSLTSSTRVLNPRFVEELHGILFRDVASSKPVYARPYHQPCRSDQRRCRRRRRQRLWRRR